MDEPTTNDQLRIMAKTLGWNKIKRRPDVGENVFYGNNPRSDSRFVTNRIPDWEYSLNDLFMKDGPVEWLLKNQWPYEITEMYIRIYIGKDDDDDIIVNIIDDDSAASMGEITARALFRAVCAAMEKERGK
jgi:hypothetical protein